MTRRSLMLVLTVAVATVHAGTLTPREDDGILVNAVVALVNSDPVTKLEVDAQVADFLRANPDVPREDLRSFWEKAREGLIEHRLLIQEAKRRNVEVDPDRVNEELERFRKAGINVEGRRDLVRERLMVQRLLRQLISARSIAPQEVTAYYKAHADQFALPERRHVYLIKTRVHPDKGGRPAAKKKAQELLERLKKGEDFVSLAKGHSQGAFADKGGDHGWLKKGSLVGPLDKAISKLKPGEVSDPVAVQDGYLLLKVAAIQPASEQSLAQARDAILARLQAQHRLKRRRQLIERLRDTASIIRLDLFRKRPKAQP